MQGQSESKKNGKNTNGAQPPQTKGTAMSFGFKKKLLYSTSGAKKSEEKERQRLQLASAEVPTSDKSAGSDSTNSFSSNASAHDSLNQSDDNGNTTHNAPVDTSPESRDTKKLGTPKLTPPRKESTGGPYRSIRFGFRQANAVRPASTGLNPTVATYENASNNNNGNPIQWPIFKNTF